MCEPQLIHIVKKGSVGSLVHVTKTVHISRWCIGVKTGWLVVTLKCCSVQEGGDLLDSCRLTPQWARSKTLGNRSWSYIAFPTREKDREKMNMFCKCRTPGDIFLKKNVSRNYSCSSVLKAGPKMMMMCHLHSAQSSIKPFLRTEFLTCWTYFLAILPLSMHRPTDIQWHAKNVHVSKDQLLYSRSPIPWQGFEMPFTAHNKAQNQMEFSDPHRKQNFDFILETKMAGLAQCAWENWEKIMLMIGNSFAHHA